MFLGCLPLLHSRLVTKYFLTVISHTQARIASYMYISPDASPADALIKSKLNGAGMLLGGEGDEVDASSSSDTFLGETSARADTSSGVSKVPGGAERSEQIAVEEFTATAKLQFVSYTGHQDASQPVGRVNEVRDLDSSSKERTNYSITNECIAIVVDSDRNPMLAPTEDGPKECYEVSTKAKEVHGGGVTAKVEMGNAQAEEAEADGDVKEEQLAAFTSPYKTIESLFPSSSHSPTSSSSHPGASTSTLLKYSSQNFKYPYPFLGLGTGIRTGTGVGTGAGTGRGVLTSSGNMFHNLMFSGMGGTGTGTNTEDVSLSVRDMDMGNISYDTISFAADRMMTLGQSSLLDLNNTEDLLKDIFRDEEKDDEDDDDDDEDDDGLGDGADGTAATVMGWNADPQSSLTGPQDKDRDCNGDKDSDSSTDDFDGIFRLP